MLSEQNSLDLLETVDRFLQMRWNFYENPKVHLCLMIRFLSLTNNNNNNNNYNKSV